MEKVDRKRWQNVTGTGPFALERYVQANAQIYKKNEQYWDSALSEAVDIRYPSSTK